MKPRIFILCALFAASITLAVTLRPSTIVYGVIRDSYGLRLSPESAMVGAFLSSNEVARTTIQIQPADSNYRLDVNVVDPLTAGPKHVVPGSTVAIKVRIGSVIQQAIGSNNVVIAGNGTAVRVDLVLGVDSDGDGLPDDWEWLAILNSGGRITSLSQVGPGHDLDGDGVSDDQEFWLGTFPFLPNDELRIQDLAHCANGRVSFTFMPIENLDYSVEYTPTLDQPNWSICPVSLSESGPLVAGSVKGGTQRITLFLDGTQPTRFWRLRQQ